MEQIPYSLLIDRAGLWGDHPVQCLTFRGCLPHSNNHLRAGQQGKEIFEGDKRGKRKERRVLLASVRPRVGQGGGWRLAREGAVYRHLNKQELRI